MPVREVLTKCYALGWRYLGTCSKNEPLCDR